MDTRTKVSFCCDILNVARKYDDSGLQESIINLVNSILHEHAGDVLYNDVKRVYENDGKISAIKLYKGRTGSSLLDAKLWVEAQADKNNWKKCIPQY